MNPNLQPVKFGAYGNSARPPVHRVDPEKTPIHPEIVPDFIMPTGVDLDRSAIITEAEIPEVSPVFSGLRRYITEHRIDRAQKKTEKLAMEYRVLDNAGRSIITGDGYSRETVETRPVTIRERIAANRLERIAHKRRMKQNRVNHLVNTVADPKNPINRLGFDPSNPEQDTVVRRTGSDNASIRSNRGQATRIQQVNSGLRDRRYSKNIMRPAQKAERVIKKRDRLVLKSEALRREIR